MRQEVRWNSRFRARVAVGRGETAGGTNREQQRESTAIKYGAGVVARLSSMKAAYVRYTSEITCRLSWNE